MPTKVFEWTLSIKRQSVRRGNDCPSIQIGKSAANGAPLLGEFRSGPDSKLGRALQHAAYNKHNVPI